MKYTSDQDIVRATPIRNENDAPRARQGVEVAPSEVAHAEECVAADNPSYPKLKELLARLESPDLVANPAIIDTYVDSCRRLIENFKGLTFTDAFTIDDETPMGRSGQIERIKQLGSGRFQRAFREAYKACAEALVTDFVYKVSHGYCHNSHIMTKKIDEIRTAFAFAGCPTTRRVNHQLFQIVHTEARSEAASKIISLFSQHKTKAPIP